MFFVFLLYDYAHSLQPWLKIKYFWDIYLIILLNASEYAISVIFIKLPGRCFEHLNIKYVALKLIKLK